MLAGLVTLTATAQGFPLWAEASSNGSWVIPALGPAFVGTSLTWRWAVLDAGSPNWALMLTDGLTTTLR